MLQRSNRDTDTSLISLFYEDQTCPTIGGPGNPDRQSVEDFIKRIYRERYRATIRVDYPNLISLRDASGNITAAAGIRLADRGPLFLERYTGKAIEEILGCRRRDVAEIGNLAADGRGACMRLFIALARHLDGTGICFAAATGTVFLHRLFNRLGLQPQVICPATPEAIGGTMSWGSYYETQPRVLVGSVAKGIEQLGAGAKFRQPSNFSRSVGVANAL